MIIIVCLLPVYRTELTIAEFCAFFWNLISHQLENEHYFFPYFITYAKSHAELTVVLKVAR